MDIQTIIEKALPIIFANEGNYKSVNPDDNGALSVGKVQWHGNRALSILKKIINKDKTEAKSVLGSLLYDDIVKSVDWCRRILNVAEASRISNFINSENGRAIQDTQARADVAAYINNATKLKLVDPSVLIYYADVENQGGAGASRRIGQAAIKSSGAADKVTLDIYHSCALNDRVMSKYAKRRTIVYNKCKKIFEKAVNPYREPNRTIALGIKGEDVKWVQWELRNAGYNIVKVNGINKDLKVDGDCGPVTNEGIRAYQKDHNLLIDGKVGPKTRVSFIND